MTNFSASEALHNSTTGFSGHWRQHTFTPPSNNSRHVQGTAAAVKRLELDIKQTPTKHETCSLSNQCACRILKTAQPQKQNAGSVGPVSNNASRRRLKAEPIPFESLKSRGHTALIKNGNQYQVSSKSGPFNNFRSMNSKSSKLGEKPTTKNTDEPDWRCSNLRRTSWGLQRHNEYNNRYDPNSRVTPGLVNSDRPSAVKSYSDVKSTTTASSEVRKKSSSNTNADRRTTERDPNSAIDLEGDPTSRETLQPWGRQQQSTVDISSRRTCQSDSIPPISYAKQLNMIVDVSCANDSTTPMEPEVFTNREHWPAGCRTQELVKKQAAFTPNIAIPGAMHSVSRVNTTRRSVLDTHAKRVPSSSASAVQMIISPSSSVISATNCSINNVPAARRRSTTKKERQKRSDLLSEIRGVLSPEGTASAVASLYQDRIRPLLADVLQRVKHKAKEECSAAAGPSTTIQTGYDSSQMACHCTNQLANSIVSKDDDDDYCYGTNCWEQSSKELIMAQRCLGKCTNICKDAQNQCERQQQCRNTKLLDVDFYSPYGSHISDDDCLERFDWHLRQEAEEEHDLQLCCSYCDHGDKYRCCVSNGGGGGGFCHDINTCCSNAAVGTRDMRYILAYVGIDVHYPLLLHRQQQEQMMTKVVDLHDVHSGDTSRKADQHHHHQPYQHKRLSNEEATATLKSISLLDTTTLHEFIKRYCGHVLTCHYPEATSSSLISTNNNCPPTRFALLPPSSSPWTSSSTAVSSTASKAIDAEISSLEIRLKALPLAYTPQWIDPHSPVNLYSNATWRSFGHFIVTRLKTTATTTTTTAAATTAAVDFGCSQKQEHCASIPSSLNRNHIPATTSSSSSSSIPVAIVHSPPPPKAYQFKGGRYGLALELRKAKLPYLACLCLGELCHLVQLAISAKLLAYENSVLQPTASCLQIALTLLQHPSPYRSLAIAPAANSYPIPHLHTAATTSPSPPMPPSTFTEKANTTTTMLSNVVVVDEIQNGHYNEYIPPTVSNENDGCVLSGSKIIITSKSSCSSCQSSVANSHRDNFVDLSSPSSAGCVSSVQSSSEDCSNGRDQSHQVHQSPGACRSGEIDALVSTPSAAENIAIGGVPRLDIREWPSLAGDGEEEEEKDEHQIQHGEQLSAPNDFMSINGRRKSSARAAGDNQENNNNTKITAKISHKSDFSASSSRFEGFINSDNPVVCNPVYESNYDKMSSVHDQQHNRKLEQLSRRSSDWSECIKPGFTSASSFPSSLMTPKCRGDEYDPKYSSSRRFPTDQGYITPFLLSNNGGSEYDYDYVNTSLSGSRSCSPSSLLLPLVPQSFSAVQFSHSRQQYQHQPPSSSVNEKEEEEAAAPARNCRTDTGSSVSSSVVTIPRIGPSDNTNSFFSSSSLSVAEQQLQQRQQSDLAYGKLSEEEYDSFCTIFGKATDMMTSTVEGHKRRSCFETLDEFVAALNDLLYDKPEGIFTAQLKRCLVNKFSKDIIPQRFGFKKLSECLTQCPEAARICQVFTASPSSDCFVVIHRNFFNRSSKDHCITSSDNNNLHDRNYDDHNYNQQSLPSAAAAASKTLINRQTTSPSIPEAFTTSIRRSSAAVFDQDCLSTNNSDILTGMPATATHLHTSCRSGNGDVSIANSFPSFYYATAGAMSSGSPASQSTADSATTQHQMFLKGFALFSREMGHQDVAEAAGQHQLPNHHFERPVCPNIESPAGKGNEDKKPCFVSNHCFLSDLSDEKENSIRGKKTQEYHALRHYNGTLPQTQQQPMRQHAHDYGSNNKNIPTDIFTPLNQQLDVSYQSWKLMRDLTR